MLANTHCTSRPEHDGDNLGCADTRSPITSRDCPPRFLPDNRQLLQILRLLADKLAVITTTIHRLLSSAQTSLSASIKALLIYGYDRENHDQNLPPYLSVDMQYIRTLPPASSSFSYKNIPRRHQRQYIYITLATSFIAQWKLHQRQFTGAHRFYFIGRKHNASNSPVT